MTPEQISALNAPLHPSAVKERTQSGRSLAYVEGHHVIREANRIFGFGEWTYAPSSPPIMVQCEEKAKSGGKTGTNWYVGYTAQVRVTALGAWFEDVGFGQGIDDDLGRAHESAIKEAVTDGLKRALKNFGDPFGLALYDKGKAHVAVPEPVKAKATKPKPMGYDEAAEFFKGLTPKTTIAEDAKAFRELAGDQWVSYCLAAKEAGTVTTVEQLLKFANDQAAKGGA